MLWRKPYVTQTLWGPTALDGEGLVVAVPSWELISQAEMWHRLRDRDAEACLLRFKLFFAEDSDQLESCLPPSRLPFYSWAEKWPFEVEQVIACVPSAGLTVIGPPTEDAWETVLKSLGVGSH